MKMTSYLDPAGSLGHLAGDADPAGFRAGIRHAQARGKGSVIVGPKPDDDQTLFRAVAAVAEGLYVLDSKGRIASVNPAALSILGYADEEELLGRPSHETMHYLRPDGSPFPAEECPLLRPRLTGETVRVEQDWFVRKGGSRVVVSYSSAPVDVDGGRGAVVAFQDISHRLRLGDLEASRARIVAAADGARRRIERDLHDGAQQRLVSLGFALRGAAAMTPPEQGTCGPDCRDDGIGGADATLGSGLVGLCDRVEALAGTMEISSPAGGGTALHVILPVVPRHEGGD